MIVLIALMVATPIVTSILHMETTARSNRKFISTLPPLPFRNENFVAFDPKAAAGLTSGLQYQFLCEEVQFSFCYSSFSRKHTAKSREIWAKSEGKADVDLHISFYSPFPSPLLPTIPWSLSRHLVSFDSSKITILLFLSRVPTKIYRTVHTLRSRDSVDQTSC